jgi:plastocyanin
MNTRTYWLPILLSIQSLLPDESGDKANPNATRQSRPSINIVDQYGRHVPNTVRDVGGRIFDVTVGPANNYLVFAPATLGIIVGDTVRWTWASSEHSVTSGTPCAIDGQFCSPDDTNCDAGILSDVGFVYEHTFTEAGTYSYFCIKHCSLGMTGVITVRTLPTRPRPTPHPRPIAVR